ncbi:MAG: hypothetical protein M5U26_01760 [Planctomycetota bacterium]|nr:hypothetical protein [Planctomycetota bacterium]
MISKVIGIVCLVASGVLGYIAFDKYKEHNRGADAVNKSVLGEMGLQVKKEIPRETWYFGVGGGVCLLVGLGALIRK